MLMWNFLELRGKALGFSLSRVPLGKSEGNMFVIYYKYYIFCVSHAKITIITNDNTIKNRNINRLSVVAF